jgi:hypothetical protein
MSTSRVTRSSSLSGKKATSAPKVSTKKKVAVKGTGDVRSDSPGVDAPIEKTQVSLEGVPTDTSTGQEVTSETQKILVELLAQSMANAANPPSSQSSTRREVEVRLRDSPTYKGESGEHLDSWALVLDLHHRDFVGVQGASEARFVASAAKTLSGSAIVWWLSIPIASSPATWSEMKAAVRKQFQPITSDENARSDLMKLSQGPKQTVVAYAGEFRRLLTLTGPAFAAPQLQQFLVERFRDGLLNKDIARDLKKQPIEKLAHAIEMATRLDGCDGPSGSSLAAASFGPAIEAQLAVLQAQIQALQHGRGGSSSSSGPRGGYESRRDRGANKGSIGTLARRVPGLTDALAKARRENDQCLYCGSKDHIMRDCPDRVAKKAPSLN